MRTRGKGRGIFLILWALTLALLLPGMALAAMSDGAFLELADMADAAAVAKALGEGANLNARDKDGQTALIRAATRGNADKVAALLQAGADANLVDKHGYTARVWASFRAFELWMLNKEDDPVAGCARLP